MVFVIVCRVLKISRESWKQSRVVALDETIDDIGTISTIKVRPDGKKLIVDGLDGQLVGMCEVFHDGSLIVTELTDVNRKD